MFDWNLEMNRLLDLLLAVLSLFTACLLIALSAFVVFALICKLIGVVFLPVLLLSSLSALHFVYHLV